MNLGAGRGGWLADHAPDAGPSAGCVMKRDIIFDPTIAPDRPLPRRNELDAVPGMEAGCWTGCGVGLLAFILAGASLGSLLVTIGFGRPVAVSACLVVAFLVGRPAYKQVLRRAAVRTPKWYEVILDIQKLGDDTMRRALRCSGRYANSIILAATGSGLDAADARASTAHVLRSIARIATEHDAVRAQIKSLDTVMTSEEQARAEQALQAAQQQIVSRMNDLRDTMEAVQAYAAEEAKRLRRQEMAAQVNELDERIDQLLAVSQGERTVDDVDDSPGTTVLRHEAETRLRVLRDLPL